MVLRSILMLIMVSFLMGIHPEKSQKTLTISLATAERQFQTQQKMKQQHFH